MENPADSNSYQIALKKRQEVAKGTMAFYFDRPSGFTFTSGQFIDLSLPDLLPADPEGHSRAFTLASAPSEHHLMVATRLRNTTFKRRLSDMLLETPVNIEGPFGRFTLAENPSQPKVFLAGGIGITPFRSMIIDATQKKLSDPLMLFYSNRHPEDAAFLEEVQNLQEENRHYTCIPTMTGPEAIAKGWKGETGHIDEAMIKKYVDDLRTALFYVVGPPGMVSGLRKMLEAAGVQKTNIRHEVFVGY